MTVALTEGLSAALRDISGALSDVERADRQGSLLLSMATELYCHREPESLGVHIISTALAMTHTRRAALIRWDEATSTGEVVYASRGHLVRTGLQVDQKSIAGRVCQRRSSLVLEDAAELGDAARVYGTWEMPRSVASLAVIPFRAGDHVTGAIVIEGDTVGSIREDDRRNLQLLGYLVAGSFDAVWAASAVDQRVHIDKLTGLANRHHFDERLQQIVAEAERYGGAVSVVVVDIDRLKFVNDRYGPEVGNAVLRQMAQRFQASVRTVDCCARYGGEEIALILPRTNQEGVRFAAERLHKGSSNHPYTVGDHTISLTVSIGTATFPSGARSAKELIDTADRALYDAKRTGRNKVVIGAA